MFEEAHDYGLQKPELVDMGSDFRINLYRKRPVVDSYGVVEPKYVSEREIFYDAKAGTKVGTDGTKVGTDGVITSEILTDEEKLISLIRGNGEITQKQMSQKTGLPLRTIKRMTVQLQKSGKIHRVGNSRSGKWQA